MLTGRPILRVTVNKGVILTDNHKKRWYNANSFNRFFNAMLNAGVYLAPE